MNETKNLIDILYNPSASERQTLEEAFPVLYRKLQPSLKKTSKSHRRRVEVSHYRMERIIHPFWKDIHPF